MAITTLCELYLESLRFDKPDCLLHKVGGKYVPVSTAELATTVRKLGSALAALGVRRGDRVALMAESGPHWPAVDFATLTTGAVLVPIYPTLLAPQAAYIANDAGATVVFVQGAERLSGLLAESASTPSVKHFIAIDAASSDPRVMSLDALLASAADPGAAEFEQRAREAKPEDLATFIYTSGTTGNPKGVMLTHGNITSNVVNCLSLMDIRPEYTALSFLPLSHSFERTIDYMYFSRGVTIAYAESVQTVAQNFGEVRAHLFVSVPRVYEKVQARVHENVTKSSGTKQKIFAWASGVAREALPYRLRQQKPPGLLGVKLALADKLVFGKIRERLGGRFVFAFSGGAPLAKDVAEFFWGAGISIYEGYGLTETSPVITVNTPGQTKLGTVGRPIPTSEVRIAADGEILARGPNIMKGYFNNPDATAEAIDAEGWFHTGDIGQIDDDGFVMITDRKKELIVNAYGKNIAPAPIENSLKSSRFVAQAVVIGDRKNFLSALIVPDFETLKAWVESQGMKADDDVAKLLAEPRIQSLFRTEVERVNRELARYEQIVAWELIPAEFTLEGGELTPTQKVKRRVIHEKYGDVIDRLYASSDRA